MSLLELSGITQGFGERQVLNGLNLQLERGEVYGLLGPNGCGKSTVMNIVCGLLKPDAGAVRLGAASIGFCPQNTALYRDLLPAENLGFFARLHGLNRDQRRTRVAALMQAFALAPFANTRVGQLSGGWQQRLNIAVALVHEPELLVLDEPSAAVDVQARRALWALVESLRSTGISILLSTHQLDEAQRLCTRVGLMQGGRIAAQGTQAELIAQVPAQAVAQLESRDEAALEIRAAQRGWAARRYAGQLCFLLPQMLSLHEVMAAFEGIAITSASVQPVTLQHAYLEVMDAALTAPPSPHRVP